MAAESKVDKTELEKRILRYLHENGSIDNTRDRLSEFGVQDHTDMVGCLKSLHSDGYVELEEIKKEEYVLTDEAKEIVEQGSPEFHFCQQLPTEGMLVKEAAKQFSKGFGKAKKAQWVAIQKDTVVPKDVPKEDEPQVLLQRIVNGDEPDAKTMKDLQKRKLVKLEKSTSYKVNKGPNYALERKRQPVDFTQDLLDSGEWANLSFKPYNFKSLGAPVGGGCLHPLLKVRTEFRQILLEMGFSEMPTNRWVENSFWNFDALFQPQSHPARDMHDTFFVKDPAQSTKFPEDYLERVKKMHEEGGHGSIGYRYDWKREEAQKNILRTHTTAVSARMLYELANSKGGFQPTRYFSIDRVFRNETLDATHLAEFHQVEGLVADYNLSMRDLIGTIAEFFRRIGIDKLKFKPAYNPYTEPSMEIFGYHPDLKKWTEIGNSGIFRPEMLAPMGLPSNVRVIAWGLSLERPTMIKYRLRNIRDLCGHKVPISQIRTSPIVRFKSAPSRPDGTTAADLDTTVDN
eukprot:gb/GECG01010574.1/.p1 GENE.gb/GECG01010574.1/~~gb/GECG01010574.1/.p1  ORF type:complete len:515 (+),score=64.90 gb/GECG01010574.1/:1-1545(+)